MRLWSLHPQYLDSRGLVALWREALLAQQVLSGKTRGYTHHPQLERFAQHDEPLAAIARYLSAVAAEGAARGYVFDRAKILHTLPTKQITPGGQGVDPVSLIAVTTGQLDYERAHLSAKLQRREPSRLTTLPTTVAQLRSHPLFYPVEGGVASWERMRESL